MATTPQTVAAAVGGLAVLVATGTYTLTDSTDSHIEIAAPDALVAGATTCVQQEVMLTPAGFTEYGLTLATTDGKADSAADEYGVMRVCAPTPEKEAISPDQFILSVLGEKATGADYSVVPVGGTAKTVPYVEGYGGVEIWAAQYPKTGIVADIKDTLSGLVDVTPTEPTPFKCACATGPDCVELRPRGDGGWAQAIPGNTIYNPYDGGECLPKPCVELAGIPSAPPACKEWETANGQ